ncbi:alpha-ketoacid dehydrogenase subunit beta [Salsipaludibacter albus]|uniref:alpha-ketoacid dehydrogenase subunit beta n=1 Tax=Salsipaludibacter albus TaxID=2849650 RepID=UPI001EE3F8BB|nr:alpha-ketoacid dehydrogenase subunit beta [Salsipaludibacter albus]MBY5164218.1 alpha-ketoacid dehydrogenase subunit beta [Salsipaludibacter albus]
MTVTLAQAINRGIHDAMEADDRVLMFGEDVGKLGGVFRVTDTLQETFGTDRVYDTPLAESGIIGTAIGLAMYGFRPVAEMQFDGFAYPAFEQFTSHLAKMRNRSRGRVKLPVTVRIPFGGGIGAVEHHSESPETYWAHTAGLKVVSPGTVADGYAMTRAAIAADDPVIVLEPKRRYWMKDDLELPVTTEPLHKAVVRRPGTDVTVVAYGPMLKTAMEAADAAEEEGWSLEVVDLRSLSPIDTDTLVASLQRTGRMVVVHEAAQSLGPAAEIAARMQQEAFYHLEAPILRATGYDTPYPPAMLEEFWLPDVDRILDRVEEALDY